jgi:hypothetical protein
MLVAMAQPRLHHHLARLYQRGFARRTGRRHWKVRIVERSSGASRIRDIEKAFALPHWNSIVDEDGNRDAAVEVALAERVDRPAAPGIQALRNGELPEGRDRRLPIAVFMAAQLSRGRAVRENLARFVAETQHIVMKLTVANYTDEQWLDAIGEVPTDETKARLSESEKHVEIQPTNAALLDALLSSTTEIAEILLKRRWGLIRLDNPGFFTGEHPVVHVNAEPSDVGFGVATADQLHFPVSPSTALVLSHPWSDWPAGVVTGSCELVERLNWATLTHPSNGELLLHPDVQGHPLPSVGLLCKRGFWPWKDQPHFPKE